VQKVPQSSGYKEKHPDALPDILRTYLVFGKNEKPNAEKL
jgi:hypothetical protein